MIRPTNSEVLPSFGNAVFGLGHSRPFRASAFTLIEIVVALTVAAVILAIAIPTIKGLGRAEAARVPLKLLGEAVQEARKHAMREHRSYQIVFEHDGIHASPAMYPYEKRDEFLKRLEEMRTPPRIDVIERTIVQRTEVKTDQPINGRPQERNDAEKEEAPARFVPPWTVSIPLPAEAECEVLMWGDGEWDVIEGDKVRRWVIQPTGMVNPARVLLHTEAAELEAGFDILTGELTGERTRLASAKP